MIYNDLTQEEKIIFKQNFVLLLFTLVLFSTGSAQTPINTVRDYLEAMKAMKAEEMIKYVANDYTLVSTDGAERLYKRDLAFPICDWERGMNTEWSYEIIGVNQNKITVILKEKNDYFTLLDLGMRTQVSEYSVESGKIRRSISKVVVEERGTQSDAYKKFVTWLIAQPNLSEPELLDNNNNLKFDGKSAPRMLHWLKIWNRLQNQEGEKL